MENEFKGQKLGIIDDDAGFAKMLIKNIEQEIPGVEVIYKEDPIEAIKYFKENPVTTLLVDFRMKTKDDKEYNGDECIREIRKFDKEAVINLITGFAQEKPAREMLRELDIQGYINKTIDIDDMMILIISALKSAQQIKTIKEQEKTIDMLTYKKGLMAQVIDERIDIFKTMINLGTNRLNELHQSIKDNNQEKVEELIPLVRGAITNQLEVVLAFGFENELAKDLGAIKKVSETLSGYKINVNANMNVLLCTPANNFLIYLIIELRNYKKAKTKEAGKDSCDYNLNIDATLDGDIVKIILSEQHDYEYDDEFVNRLNKLVASAELVEIKAVDGKIVAEVGNITSNSGNSIIIGRDWEREVLD